VCLGQLHFTNIGVEQVKLAQTHLLRLFHGVKLSRIAGHFTEASKEVLHLLRSTRVEENLPANAIIHW
jgi:hypothetical protein